MTSLREAVCQFSTVGSQSTRSGQHQCSRTQLHQQMENHEGWGAARKPTALPPETYLVCDFCQEMHDGLGPPVLKVLLESVETSSSFLWFQYLQPQLVNCLRPEANSGVSVGQATPSHLPQELQTPKSPEKGTAGHISQEASPGEEAWQMMLSPSFSGTTVWHTARSVRNS